MSHWNFTKICAAVRFDIRATRSRDMKEAPIQYVWQYLIDKCKTNYIPSEQLTVDEQLCNTKGRLSFKTYIPTKPGKYGIKIWVLADAINDYLCNAQIYTGKKTMLLKETKANA